jgi:uncharacterized protein with HEPN domain
VSKKDWRIHAIDMIECCRRIISHTDGLSRMQVFQTKVVYDAVMWNIGFLGEAAGNVPPAVRSANPNVPWRDIISARNRLIHTYGRIDDDVIWDIVSCEIYNLRPQLQSLVSGGTDQPGT